ncbi:Senescence-associated protein DH [Citrus sinensis]|uniref:Tetraspanin n=1 Tax=Citrus clementina TaxID=85681 RepID=V4TQV3_CITCL|nr:tetraspanin-11 [Citrus x clementina]XP_006485845.2 tetraspanin-11-like [Citrus sinensis]ESR54105.1 hypothetical protein CICLE_v10024025mg [Citrus x clementina]KAH9722446.1 Senescence-associated protein DH [Citrus sinensis]
MARASNIFVGFLSLCFLVLGIVALSFSLAIHFHGGTATACQKSLYTPLLVTAIFLSVLSLLGLIGSCCKNNFLLYLYLIVLFLLILGLCIFAVFVFAVTSNSAGKAVSRLGFKEYRLGDYKNWLKNHLVNDKNWNEIRSCMIDSQVCKSLERNTNNNQTAADFFKRNLSPIQSGCCKPPVACGFQYQNATFWISPTSGRPAVNDGDCSAWSNKQDALCFNCNSCKAGVLVNIKKEWKVLTIINVCALVFIILMYSCGCYALRNNRSDKRFSRYRYAA